MKKLFILLLLAPFIWLSSCSTEPDDVTQRFSFDAEGNTVLEPPPSGEGLQIQIAPFDIPIGEEVQRDYYVKLPNQEDIYIHKIEVAMNEGTHHLNVFRSTLELPDTLSTRRESTINYTYNGKQTTEPATYNDQSFKATSIFNDSDILIEAQLAGQLFTWDLPKLPGGKQSVVHLKKNEGMILQIHYANATTQATKNHKGKVSINVWYSKVNSPSFEKTSMMFARNMLIKIDSMKTDQAFSKNCYFQAIPRPMYILGMTGHFHSRGKKFIVDKMKLDPVTNDRTVLDDNIYVSDAWAEPPFTPYADPIKLDVYEYLRYTCIYDNPTKNTYLFGPRVETNEHSNLFVWFTPSYLDGTTLYDSSND
jgi:hypothetical protein